MKCSSGPNQNTLFNIRPEIVISLFLVIAILVVYWQVNNYDFTIYDDGVYVYENKHIQDGLTFSNISWALTATYFSNWHPLTWLSYMADISLYGMNPGQFHLTNLFSHALNALLLFYLLRLSTGKAWPSAFVAALFALHPLHVESVVWISERKDLLSAFWGLLTFISYVFYVRKNDIKWYLFAFLCFCGSLMSKPMLVTLPFLLLLWDYWPLNRLPIPINRNNKTTTKPNQAQLVFKIVLEKMPFLLPALFSGLMTLYAQQARHAIASANILPFDTRIANAFVSYVSYIIKMFWPFGLAVFYPHPGYIPLWKTATVILLIGMLSLMIFRHRFHHPHLFVGWLWYLVMLAPVIGIIQVGSQAMADRYTYLPLTGLFIIVAWGTPSLLPNRYFRKTILFISTFVILISLIIISHIQVQYWKNDITLFQHTLDVTRANVMAHNNLGIALAKKGKLSEAISHYRNALNIKFSNKKVHYNLGLALAELGRSDEAIGHLYSVIKIDPNYEKAHISLGRILAAQGKIDQAIHHYRSVLSQNPNLIKVHSNLVNIFFARGDIKEAIYHCSEIVKLNPDDKLARHNLKYLISHQAKSL